MKNEFADSPEAERLRKRFVRGETTMDEFADEYVQAAEATGDEGEIGDAKLVRWVMKNRAKILFVIGTLVSATVLGLVSVGSNVHDEVSSW